MADNQSNRNSNTNNRNSNYEGLHRNRNNQTSNGRRIRFTNTRRVRPIKKKGKSKPVGNRHKTRTRTPMHANYPDERNVLRMVQGSTQASRVASEVAQLFAEYDTYEDMMQALYAKPMNAYIKSLVYGKLERNATNLRAPLVLPVSPPAHPAHLRAQTNENATINAIATANLPPPGGYSLNDPRYNVTKDPLYQ